MRALALALLAAPQAADGGDALAAARVALDAGRPAHAVEALEHAPAGSDRALLLARAYHAASDYAGVRRAVASVPDDAAAAERATAAWWGANAALWQQDGAGARRWVAELERALADPSLEAGVRAGFLDAARDYGARADEFVERTERVDRARTRAWATVLAAGAASLAALLRLARGTR